MNAGDVLSPDELEHFETEGYVVLRQAVPPGQVAAAVDAIWQFLDMDRHDPDDWYRPPHGPSGLVELYQHQAFWDNRQSPRLYRAFCQLWKTDKLWISLDRASLKLPQSPRHPDWTWPSFMHWDLDLDETPVQFGVQGVLCLSDTTVEQGGFHCIPGMHREVLEWSRIPPFNARCRLGLRTWPRLTNRPLAFWGRNGHYPVGRNIDGYHFFGSKHHFQRRPSPSLERLG